MRPQIFARYRPGRLARNGTILLGWMLLRASMQAATVVWLARQLGAQTYGQFVAVVAVSSFFSPFVGLGLSHILLRNAARDPAHAGHYLARALRWWLRTLLPCVAASVVVALWLLPERIALQALIVVAAAELSATSLTELCARHLQAQQRTHAFGAVHAGLPGVRLAAVGLLWASMGDAGIVAVLWTYAASGLIYAGLLWRPLRAAAKAPDAVLPEPMTARSGLPFSLAVFAAKLQSEFNKPMLAQAGFGLAGTYNVAQRVVDMASLPVLALQEALWPRLYAQANPVRQLLRTGAALLVLALAMGVALWLVAPVLPVMFGADFADAVAVLRMLAWLPLLQVLRALLNCHAIHYGRMQQIGWAYAIGGVVSVVSVAVLAPVYGLTGAVWASYAAEVTMVVFFLLSVLRKYQYSG
ncbi:oligosaccharide flippase family protein [Acidovorax sp. JG5]|uniref:lipopolysaccharide biosynthesis protein n=1 Tax=Acidovorax sp. JG5 TaxID=2822718 RepID=UPI001B32F1CA|nr:oligosaccharide flippase family protein [Acidovorax sp. JG5]MBP3979305.1 oligosaccharide flippase family protein [Acidovorax sp. JG5]